MDQRDMPEVGFKSIQLSNASYQQRRREKVEGARKVWGTLKTTTTSAVLSTLVKLTSVSQEDITVKRKYKENKWWFVLRGNEAVLKMVEDKWSIVLTHTSWKIMPLFRFSDTGTLIGIQTLKEHHPESVQELSLRETVLEKTPQSVRRAQERHLESAGNATDENEEEIRELQVEEKEKHLEKVPEKLESYKQKLSQFKNKEKFHMQNGGYTLALKWKEVKKAPMPKKYRGPNAVADGEIVYLRPAYTSTVHAYNSKDDTWSQLPELEPICEEWNSLVVINNLLTTVGGQDKFHDKTNKLFSLTRKGMLKRKTWREVFPPMPTARASTITLCTGQALLVAGGWNQSGQLLRIVEVMGVATQQWSSVAHLPQPLYSASVALCDNRIYILGQHSNPSSSVYMCTLADLFLSCWSRSLGKQSTHRRSLSSQPMSDLTVWTQVADLPVIRSTCVTLHDRLLAIGGRERNGTPTSDVHIYNPSSNTWEVISKMNISRQFCFAAPLPNDKLMVVGGFYTSDDPDIVEIATIV